MPVRYLSAALQAFPTQLKVDALLWIGQLRLARADAEKRRIEILDTVNDSARPHVVGMFALGAWNRWIEFIHAEAGNRFATLAQVCPERIDIARAGEASGHGNDGNGFVARFARARADPLARNSRRATAVEQGRQRPRRG